MNRTNNRSLITLAAVAAAALLSAGTTFAQEATPDTWLQQATSTKTRAAVQAELATARANGDMKVFRSGYIEPVRNSALRAEVRAETLRALAAGEVAAINAEAGNPGQAPVARNSTRLAAR